MPRYNISLKNLLFPLFFFEWIYLYFAEINSFNGVILGVSWFAFTLWQVVLCYKKNVLWLMVIWLFMMMYSYEPIRYFLNGETISYRRQCENDYTVYQVALLCYLFNICLSYFTKLRNVSTHDITQPQIISSPLYVWLICVVIATFCMIVGQSGDTIVESGGYGRGTGKVATSFEYGIIPMVIALRYSSTRTRKIIVLLMAMVYIIKTLLYGGRIDAIMLMIAFYTLFLHSIIKKRLAIILLFVAFVFNQAWEGIRVAINHVNISQTIAKKATEFSMSSGNSADVFYASERIIYMIHHGILGLEERIMSFCYFLLSFVRPYSSLPDLASLVSYKVDKYSSGGGGLAPVYIYAWLGIVGVILVSSLLGKLLSRFMRGKCGTFLYFYTIFVVATIPRWYAYYPIQLIKFCVYGAIFAWIMEVLRRARIPMLNIHKKRH